jgi:hypothetical protein
MKKFNFSLLNLPVALYLIAVFAFVACNREEPTAPNQQRADAIEVKDGRLHFASEELFRATIKQLGQQQNALAEWEKQFSGFTSMRTAFSQLTDEDYYKIASGNLAPYQDIVTVIGEGEEKEAMRVISDGILATLVSKDGFLYVGNKAYKFSWDQMHIVEDFTAEKLKGINFEAGQGTGEFKTMPIVHRLKRIQNQPLPSGKTAASIWCIKEYDFNGKKRMAGDIDYTDAGDFYSSANVMTKHQQRILGVWYAQNTGWVLASGSATSAANKYTINFSTGKLGNNGYVDYTFTEGVFNISTYHEAACKDYNSVTNTGLRFCELYLQ